MTRWQTIPIAFLFVLCSLAAPAQVVPPLETICPPALGVELRLLPTTLDEITIRIKPGYARSTGKQCWAMTAYHEAPGKDSLPASLASSEDCIPAPEPPPAFMVGVGVFGLLTVARSSRGKRRSWESPGKDF